MTAHTIHPSWLSDKVSKKLKQLCQSWTRLAEDEYVAVHSDMLKESCPLCKEHKP